MPDLLCAHWRRSRRSAVKAGRPRRSSGRFFARDIDAILALNARAPPTRSSSAP